MSTVQKLLCGSANLHVMQADITNLVKMLRGALEGFKHPYEQDFLIDKLSTNPNYWRTWKITPSKLGWFIRCELGLLVGSGRAYCNQQFYSLPACDIKAIHDTLDRFVDKLFATFPEIKEKLDPVLEAA